MIKVQNNEHKLNYVWSVQKFKNRLALVNDIINEHEESGETEPPTIPRETDPFWDPPQPKPIGLATL